MLRFQDLGDTEDLPPIWESTSSSSSSSSSQVKKLPLGRIFGVLFGAEPRELLKALAQDRPRSQHGLVGKAASSLIQHVKDMIWSGSPLEQTCIPMLEHAVKSKEPSYRKKSAILLRWLLQSTEVGIAVANTLEAIIGASQWDNRVKLGWCVLIRDLVHGWSGRLDVDSLLPNKTYEIFVTCIPQLVRIVCLASVKEDKKRIPTRLTIAAADCLLTITKTLAAGLPAQPEVSSGQNVDVYQQKRSLVTPLDSTIDYRSTDWLVADLSNSDNTPSTSSSDLFTNAEKRELALWEQLDNLISLVRELEEWNNRSRPLFTKGLQYIHRRLLLLENYRDSVQCQEGEGDVSVGAAVLTACWQHYSDLIITEDKKLSSHPQPILQHWLGALQQTEDSDTSEESKKALEMRGYALACLALILGRLDARRLELILVEFEPELLKAVFGQLRGADNNIVNLAVAVLRTMLFRPSSPTSGDFAAAARMESVVPMLLDMLDTRDIAARAVVLLVAEYFAANPESIEMEQLFTRLDSVESGQRRNALDVLTELLSICTRSVDMINSSLSQMIAKHLFKRLGDTELTNRVEASALFAKLDPSFTLPPLLEFLYSLDGRVRSAASAGVLSVLKGQINQSKVVTELLDCTTQCNDSMPFCTGIVVLAPAELKNMVKSSLPVQDGQTGLMISNGRKSDGPVDVDRIMRLVPDWAATVKDWESVICVVVSKMFEDPANAIIPRFLSHISIQLADQVHVLFPLILEKMRGQSKLTQDIISKLSEEDSQKSGGGALGRELFQRLSPLLILRVLPLSAFSTVSCKELYGGPSAVNAGLRAMHGGMAECITSCLLERVCGVFEFEDVRKVASELTGRLLPDIMIPLVTEQLEDASNSQDLLRVKACIYVFCTSLGIRGQESLNHPLMDHICQLLTTILLWPWSQDNKGYSKVGKAQHGCIDCLAMMICAELQPQKVESSLDESHFELSAQRSQPTLVEELPMLTEVRTSPLAGKSKIKLVEELPESEQLRGHQFVEGKQNTMVEEVPSQDNIEHKALERRRQSKLIEEICDSDVDTTTVHRGYQTSASHPAILSPVIDCLTGHQKGLPWIRCSSTLMSDLTNVNGENCVSKGKNTVPGKLGSGNIIVPLAFRVCMANVLISSCQKVAVGSRTTLASRTITPLITFIQFSTDSKLRGTCLQVLFTAVYHLKSSAVLPYAADLFGLSIAAIKSQGLLEERLAGAKLLASLLASEEALVRDLAPYLMDAQMALTSISAMDSSPELRLLCEKLLSCLSTPSDM